MSDRRNQTMPCFSQVSTKSQEAEELIARISELEFLAEVLRGPTSIRARRTALVDRLRGVRRTRQHHPARCG
jgi:hypothetical protein